MRAIWAMLCVGILTGCTQPPGPSAGAMRPEPVRLELVRVDDVPFHAHQGFRCGPEPLASMLEWTGMAITPAALQQAFTGKTTDPRVVLTATARRYGRLAYPISGLAALSAELAAGHPVLVVENLGVPGKPLWNCLVAVGYDQAAQQVLLNGDEEAKRVPLRLFERLWSDSDQWGLVVLNPGDMPAAARQADYVAAARGLERAGRAWEAVLSFDAALAQWPNDGEAMLGLASSLRLLGDIKGAAEAYRAAATLLKDPRAAQEALAKSMNAVAEATPVGNRLPRAMVAD